MRRRLILHCGACCDGAGACHKSVLAGRHMSHGSMPVFLRCVVRAGNPSHPRARLAVGGRKTMFMSLSGCLLYTRAIVMTIEARVKFNSEEATNRERTVMP
ncbi:hypothetical protein TRVL_05776 [Trypanosoma vivax]|nr:hypothetical protein TRVL_05776 [Trypanosoma vivax]